MAIQFGEKNPVAKPALRKPEPPIAKPPETPKPVAKRGRGRPRSGKETVTLRLSSSVINHFKPLGKGWKLAIDTYLVKALSL